MNGSPGVRFLVIACCALFLLAGAAERHRENVRAGLLTSGTPQTAFLEVWGPPERTRTFTSDTEEKRLEFNRFFGGFYGRANTTYEVWEYHGRGATLIFYGHDLTGWKTDRTTEQLRDSGQPPDSRYLPGPTKVR